MPEILGQPQQPGAGLHQALQHQNPRHHREGGEMVGEVFLPQGQILDRPEFFARFDLHDPVYEVETHGEKPGIRWWWRRFLAVPTLAVKRKYTYPDMTRQPRMLRAAAIKSAAGVVYPLPPSSQRAAHRTMQGGRFFPGYARICSFRNMSRLTVSNNLVNKVRLRKINGFSWEHLPVQLLASRFAITVPYFASWERSLRASSLPRVRPFL